MMPDNWPWKGSIFTCLSLLPPVIHRGQTIFCPYLGLNIIIMIYSGYSNKQLKLSGAIDAPMCHFIAKKENKSWRRSSA